MIKNFIYLDEQKLYSFSSQLFEGVTEYYLDQQVLEETEEDTQKGKLTSGRAIANAIKEASSSTSKKFLHDYAFNLLEAELINSELLIDVDSNTYTHSDICNSNKSFIRIRAKGKFVDLKEIQELLRNFPEIGDAIAKAQFVDKYQELEILQSEKQNGAAVNKLKSNIDKSVRKLKSQNQQALPNELRKSIDTMLEQFGDDIVRFKQTLGDTEYSTFMSPDNFRDSIKAICRKYSRKTAKEFVVLGTICHSHETPDVEIEEISDEASMLSHMVGLAENMYDLEQTFGSKGENEIIIEPIAVYTEL
ncbi:hypothetical protein [Vibrio sp. 99-70-13A1]|uniref:DUF6414 family protein n=1 Tax=Vibrio sp. 99-70-13A1 TaxID=2607601 RepID=UPI001493527F|nr:hypothetical protein [Vibrio sp. 99-70-13A1]NOH95328.1 hypothetical protein [Vibrio sp. 99-70-13A1]